VSSVTSPGLTRLLTNLFPGATTATALILLANGFWFVLAVMVLIRSDLASGFTGILIFPPGFQRTLIDFGALATPLVFAGEWWRLIPPIFLHGGLVHFFFNSYILLQLSPTVEEEYGTHRMLVAYLLSGVGGFLTTCLWSAIAGPRVSVGGSGAVIGLMGLLLAYGVRRGGGVGARVKAAIGQYVVYLFLISLLFRGIDHAAHVGGLATGFALGWLLPFGAYRSRSQGAFWEALSYLLSVLTVICWILVGVHFPRGG
jgi:rhomboid protease GluP